MPKKYLSSSVIAFKALGVRISFIPLSTGGSYFITDDVKLQNAIEAHIWFGTKISLEGGSSDTTESGKTPKIKKTTSTGDDGTTGESEPPEDGDGSEGKEPIEMTFDNADDAKEYVANTFNVGRTKMKKTADIIKHALDNGVKITIKE